MDQDKIERAKGIDLIDLAGRYTTLRRESGSEYSGPCPKCGGDDRFHATGEWFFCRQCHPDRGDAIDFVRWVTGADFPGAVAALTGDATAPAQPLQGVQVRPKPTKTKPRQGLAHGTLSRVAAAQDRLGHSETAIAYLEGRGLHPATWQAFRLGFDPTVNVPGSEGKERAGAIAMPWYSDGGQLIGVKYRFITATSGGKMTSAPGSDMGGRLYGYHAMRIDGLVDALIICEGEINAMSIWQAAGPAGLDVLSLGPEGNRITDATVAMAARYRYVVTWLDKPGLAKAAAKALPGAFAMYSTRGQDANDLLVTGRLAAVIGKVRIEMCGNDPDRLSDLWLQYRAAARQGHREAATIQAALEGRLSSV